jgi:hypothetical protein
VPKGVIYQVGKPAYPMPSNIRDEIKNAISTVKEIQEAHLPMIYIKGAIDPPSEVLVLVFDSDANIQHLLLTTNEKLEALLPKDKIINMLPLMQGNSMLPNIRKANCVLYGWP